MHLELYGKVCRVLSCLAQERTESACKGCVGGAGRSNVDEFLAV